MILMQVRCRFSLYLVLISDVKTRLNGMSACTASMLGARMVSVCEHVGLHVYSHKVCIGVYVLLCFALLGFRPYVMFERSI